MLRGEQRGMTFVAVLVMLAICMLGLSIAGPMWSEQAKRERERELLRVGVLYARALSSYRDSAPGSLKQFPLRLDDLLLDTRFVGTRRYVRSLYPDPTNPGGAWGLVLDGDKRIVGVYSRSEDPPIAQGRLSLDGVTLEPAQRYSDWKFVVRPTS